MGNRSGIDWEACERDWRIGKLSIKQIADKHQVSTSQLKAKAKKLEWKRDLTEAVMVATKAALIEEAKARAKTIGQEIGQQSANQTEGAIKAAVSENVAVITQHKQRARRLASAFDSLMQKLEEQLADPLRLESLILAVAANDPDAAMGLRKVTSVPSHMDTLKKAAEINSRLQNDERVSHNLDDQPPQDDERTRILRKIVEEEERARNN